MTTLTLPTRTSIEFELTENYNFEDLKEFEIEREKCETINQVEKLLHTFIPSSGRELIKSVGKLETELIKGNKKSPRECNHKGELDK